MSAWQRFHLDQGGHSVTVHVRPGLTTRAELLVDGKETGAARRLGRGGLMLTGELAEEPPQPIQVRVDLAGHPGRWHPSCTLRLGGREQAIPRRS